MVLARLHRQLHHRQRFCGAGHAPLYRRHLAFQLLEHGAGPTVHLQLGLGVVLHFGLQRITLDRGTQLHSGIRPGLPFQFDLANHFRLRNLRRQPVRDADYGLSNRPPTGKVSVEGRRDSFHRPAHFEVRSRLHPRAGDERRPSRQCREPHGVCTESHGLPRQPAAIRGGFELHAYRYPPGDSRNQLYQHPRGQWSLLAECAAAGIFHSGFLAGDAASDGEHRRTLRHHFRTLHSVRTVPGGQSRPAHHRSSADPAFPAYRRSARLPQEHWAAPGDRLCVGPRQPDRDPLGLRTLF